MRMPETTPMTTDISGDWRALVLTARRAGVSVRVLARSSSAAQVLGVVAEYQLQPPAITVYREAVRRVARQRGVAHGAVLTEALAHELAHHSEPRGLSRKDSESRARRTARREASA